MSAGCRCWARCIDYDILNRSKASRLYRLAMRAISSRPSITSILASPASRRNSPVNRPVVMKIACWIRRVKQPARNLSHSSCEAAVLDGFQNHCYTISHLNGECVHRLNQVIGGSGTNFRSVLTASVEGNMSFDQFGKTVSTFRWYRWPIAKA